MRAKLGETIVISIPAPVRTPADLAARIEAPGGVIVIAERPATYDVVERVFEGEGGGLYRTARATVMLDAPPAAGDYMIVWRAPSTGFEGVGPLFVG